MDIRKSKKEKVKSKNFPDSPGVYLFKDADGKIIYIGKAASLKKRVASYFAKGVHSYKTDILLANIAGIDYIPTASQEEALLLEAELVKEKQPKFNVMLKDDKRYPLLKLTLNEKFPRLLIARRRPVPRSQTQTLHRSCEGGKSDGAVYFGPYTSAKLLRSAVAVMRRAFPMRTCRTMPTQACLNYHIGQCVAPCIGSIDESGYREIVDDIILFLKGRKKQLLKRLSQKMKELAALRKFEEAGRIRDQIQALSVVGKKWKKRGLFLAERIEGFDISNIAGREAVGSMVSFLNAKPDKSNYRRFRINTVFSVDDYKMIQEVVLRRYKRLLREGGEFPDMIVIDGGKGHVSAAKAVLDDLKLSNIRVFGIAKKEDKIFSSCGEEHIIGEFKQLIQRVRDEAHRFAQSYHHILRRKKIIGK